LIAPINFNISPKHPATSRTRNTHARITSSLSKKPLIFFPFFHWRLKKGKKMGSAKLPYRRPPINARLKGRERVGLRARSLTGAYHLPRSRPELFLDFVENVDVE
jgi:hypothetical protein